MLGCIESNADQSNAADSNAIHVADANMITFKKIVVFKFSLPVYIHSLNCLYSLVKLNSAKLGLIHRSMKYM